MDKEQLQNLLLQYVNNSIRKDDYVKLMDLVEYSKNDSDLYIFMKQIWDSQSLTQSFTDFQSAVLYNRIVNDKRFTKEITPPALPVVKRISAVYKIWQMVAAAVIFIAVSVAISFYINRDVNQRLKDELSKNDILPGGNHAILTLSNGEKITLANAANGKLAEQAGVTITKTADGQLVYDALETKDVVLNDVAELEGKYNTIETPAGGEYQVNLPDGTKVWLNAASSLKFPASFSKKGKRKVELKGEAYFEVAHLNKQPFVVKTDRQEVEVLGTHFNVNCYENEPFTKTTLLEGRVRVTALSAVNQSKTRELKNEIMLRPGEESLLTQSQIMVKNADLETVMAWKNGSFIFKDESLYSIMRKIERWYGLEVVYKGDFTGRTFEGSISRFKNVSELLRKFEFTRNIHFKIEGRRITVMP